MGVEIGVLHVLQKLQLLRQLQRAGVVDGDVACGSRRVGGVRGSAEFVLVLELELVSGAQPCDGGSIVAQGEDEHFSDHTSCQDTLHTLQPLRQRKGVGE